MSYAQMAEPLPSPVHDLRSLTSMGARRKVGRNSAPVEFELRGSNRAEAIHLGLLKAATTEARLPQIL
jgi:hypothetical protein